MPLEDIQDRFDDHSQCPHVVGNATGARERPCYLGLDARQQTVGGGSKQALTIAKAVI